MRAAVYKSAELPLEIRDIDVPVAEAGEVLIQVARAGICGSDLHVKEYGGQPEGVVFGHEYAGVVTRLGAGTEGWSVGDRVVSLPIHPCGTCDACNVGKIALCEKIVFTGFSLDHSGAYAEYAAAPAHSLHRVPNNVGFDAAAMVEPLSVSRRAVSMAPITQDSVVLVIGTGPIGAGAVQFAKLAGARQVIVSETSQERRQLALDVGASAVIDPAAGDLGEQLKAIAGRLPDVVIEAVGVPGLIQQAISVCAYEATIVVVGACFKEDHFMPAQALSHELTIRFSNCYTHEDFGAVIEALASGDLDPSAIHTGTLTLDEVPSAFDALMTSKSGCKTLIDPSGGKL
ncbi:MAG: alcohol dehydrogenase catalytic domain-containing protein [Sphingomonadaceae bacterium]|nr:alcohol dehydrogenase catalytic domain-containing protein [Sphingomonadaceae bacterium]